jgi:hypothetical protein
VECDRYIAPSPVPNMLTTGLTQRKGSLRLGSSGSDTGQRMTPRLAHEENKIATVPGRAARREPDDRSKTNSSPECPNTACQGRHFIKDCDDTPADLKDKLLRAFHSNRRVTRSTSKIASTESASGDAVSQRPLYAKRTAVGSGDPDGRFQAVFAADVPCVVPCTATLLADYGSDDNIVPRSLVNELLAAGMFVPVQKLAQPIGLELSVQTPGSPLMTTEMVQLSVDIYAKSGPIRLRNVRWYIMESHMEEVLMGRPLLRWLGMDVESLLNNVREEVDGMDCSNIPRSDEPPRLSRLVLCKVALPAADIAPETFRDKGKPAAEANESEPLATKKVNSWTSVQHGAPEFDPVPVSEAMPLLEMTEEE